MSDEQSSAVIERAPARATRPQSRRVFEDVCKQIRQDVTLGKLRSGDKLPSERDMAEQLGVSRAAVREALRALEASGVLEFRKGVYGGAFIRDMSSTGVTMSISDMLSLGNLSLDNLTETRTCLLSFAVRMACERATEEDLAAIEASLEQVDRATDMNSRIAGIGAFYTLIAAAAHNGVLQILIEAVTLIATDLLTKLKPQSVGEGLSERRRPIVNAIRARDTDTAVHLMEVHLGQLHAYVDAHGGAKVLQSK
ncbi:FadR/GntR family transcriptional regulator [Phenylobacterium sp.]|uniref:FadR/GntR family transcriptional regulator n=1 Tax=Phenylobacterium sp. TaxID=1871053 RepID=UPI0027363B16|nr:FCD domain-containing protein [Phenylobacterium sp.]MDP3658614.1 GntR family transcriptional regulator [Phenylobacterium sp.]